MTKRRPPRGFTPDFAPIPPAQTRWKLAGTITPHHVRGEPVGGARWKVWTFARTGDQYATSAIARDVQAALDLLLEQAPQGPWALPCTACGGNGAVVMDSPAGDPHCHWYCALCEPRPPKPRRRT